MKRTKTRLGNLCTWENLILFAGLNMLFSYLVNNSPFGAGAVARLAGGQPILDLRMFYTPADAYSFFDHLGSAGRSACLGMYGFDLLFIIGYVLFNSIFIYMSIHLIFKKRNALIVLCLLPVMVGILDVLEDIAIIAMLLYYPSKLNFLAQVSGWLTSIKSWASTANMVNMAVLIPILMVSMKIKRGINRTRKSIPTVT